MLNIQMQGVAESLVAKACSWALYRSWLSKSKADRRTETRSTAMWDYLTNLMRFNDSRVQTLCKLAWSIFGIQGVDMSKLMVSISRNGKSVLHEFLNELLSETHIHNLDPVDVSTRGEKRMLANVGNANVITIDEFVWQRDPSRTKFKENDMEWDNPLLRQVLARGIIRADVKYATDRRVTITATTLMNTN